MTQVRPSDGTKMCKYGHVLTPENTYTYPNGKTACRTCRREADVRWRERHPGAVRRYRSDPEKRERDREASRRWKREHLGQPGLAREKAA